ncbi:MAG TPA: lipid-A-disaccharide synthase [Desulfonatronum sp.]|nr:lipid-A-disaccharide synthase [Desulfonatronum sp.]
MSGPLIWINACEPSGDLHGALLAKALRAACPNILLTGMGGTAMEQAGVSLTLRMENLSVMGISEVVGYLPRVFGMWRTIRRSLAQERPAAVVLIDSPDFHLRIARMAHALRIPVFYYISPQVWAWRPGRVQFLKKYVRRMLCILPFEPDFYRARGMAADYVGHPLVDELRRAEFLQVTPEKKRVGILPGSRKTEIERLMPVFSQTAELLGRRDPEINFVVIKAPGINEAFLRRCCVNEQNMTFLEPGQRYRHMRECALIMAASGTVTLESSLLGVPTIVAYKCSRLSFLVAVRLVKVPAISLTNLILKKNVLPEFIQHQATPENLANKAWSWLHDQREMEAVRRELDKLSALLAAGGVPERTATIILRDLSLLRG